MQGAHPAAALPAYSFYPLAYLLRLRFAGMGAADATAGASLMRRGDLDAARGICNALLISVLFWLLVVLVLRG